MQFPVRMTLRGPNRSDDRNHDRRAAAVGNTSASSQETRPSHIAQEGVDDNRQSRSERLTWRHLFAHLPEVKGSS